SRQHNSYTVMHTIAVSKSVACASTVLWFTMDWTSDVLASFNLKVLEQLDAHRRNGCYSLSNLHQIVIVSSMVYFCAFVVRLRLFACRKQDQFALNLIMSLS
ncbi:hypothetical protein MKX03_033053, partial [Papaver bracteatum]